MQLLAILALASWADSMPALPDFAGGQPSSVPGTLTRIDQSWWPRYADTLAVSNDGNDVLFSTGWDAAGARLSPAYSLPPQHINVEMPESATSDRMTRFGRTPMLIGGGRILYRRSGAPGSRGAYVLRALDSVTDSGPDVYFEVDAELRLVDGGWNPDKHRLWLRIAEIRGGRAEIVDRLWSVERAALGADRVTAHPSSRRPVSRPFAVTNSPETEWFSVTSQPDGSNVVVRLEGGASALVNLATGQRSNIALGPSYSNAEYVFLGGQLHAYCTYERTGPYPGWGVLRWDGRRWRQVTKDYKLDAVSPNGRFAILTRIEPAPGRSDHARYLWRP